MDEAKDLVNSMVPRFGIEADTMIFNLLIKGYTRMTPSNFEDAHATLKLCVSKGLKPSIVTFSSVANAYCSVGMPEEAEAVIRDGLKNSNLRPNCTIFNTLIKGYARCRCSIRIGSCSCVVCMCSDPEQ